MWSIDVSSVLSRVRKKIKKYASKFKNRQLASLWLRCCAIARRISREPCLRFVWLALWNTHVLQELKKDTDHGNGTCNVSFQNVALGFLRSCDQVNEGHFGLLLLVSLGYVLGQLLLVIGIDIVGRKPYLSEQLSDHNTIMIVDYISLRNFTIWERESHSFFLTLCYL